MSERTREINAASGSDAGKSDRDTRGGSIAGDKAGVAPEAERATPDRANIGDGGGVAIERVLINGHPDTLISPFDRALQFGDGLFETIACRRGRACFLTLHLERLALGCKRLGIDVGDLGELREEVRALAQEVEAAIVKLLLTRGTALVRGYGVSGHEKATRVTFRYPWPQETRGESKDGVAVRTATLRLGENPTLAGLKHCNRLEQVLARREWTDPDIAEALLYSHSGKLISGAMSNVFIVEGARLRTPRIDLCGVAGVMRRVVLREARAAGISVHEDVLGVDDVQKADEMFLTNARIGIWPVRALDGRIMGPGPVTQRMQRLLRPLLEAPADE